MEQDDLIRFGAYIKKLREIEGLSQEELAKRSGFAGRAAISAIEKGKNNISIDKLPALARALRTTPGELMNKLADDESSDLSSEVKLIAFTIEHMTPDERGEVNNFIKYIVSKRNIDERKD